MDTPRSKSRSQAYFATTDADRVVAKLAAGQWGVLSLDELRACGLSKGAVGVRVRRGNLHRRYHGIYVVGHHNLPLEGQFLAAVKACGVFAVLSHYSAAALHELVKWDGRPFEITAPTKHTHPRIKAHRSDSIDRQIVKGIPVTPKLRTVIDLRTVADDETVKRALRAAKFTAAELAQLPACIVDLGAVSTRSPVEDSAYDVVLAAGLQTPSEVNAPYRLPSGTVYPDLRWPELRLIVEVDSAEWHDDPLAQIADRERQAELEAVGERVLRVRKTELANRPRRFLARLRAAGVPAT
jgi:hypothetical protein